VEITAPSGFVYVATGERYLREAAGAAAQLRRTNPGARICLVSDRLTGEKFWDDLVVLPEPSFSFRDKLALRFCPYERFVYLDTDTHVVGDLSEIFQLLERFDLAGHQLFEGHDSPIPGVPDAFPEFQGGVLAFRRSIAVDEFFTRWLAHYDAFRAPGRPDRDAYANVTDQKSLRLALYESGLRLAVLGPEYDFTPAHVNFACASVRILHGRGDDFNAFACRINARLGNRVYHPTLDVVLHAQSTAPEIRRLCWRSTLQVLRGIGVACIPLALRNRLRKNETIRRFFFGGRFAP
jgi:hypothetical protein